MSTKITTAQSEYICQLIDELAEWAIPGVTLEFNNAIGYPYNKFINVHIIVNGQLRRTETVAFDGRHSTLFAKYQGLNDVFTMPEILNAD